ncbi:ferritin-like domain-containing protein [Herbiconiux liangxiaofengii]|uniref:ferritin-like domain-containing protein n=1 Tax=Herbiconiux liangxiaofengii TaxID=3342795 RepID=UPI0035B7BFFF
MTTHEFSETGPFTAWAEYFSRNTARHDRLDRTIPWGAISPLPAADIAAIARSLQRFELGESGEGEGLRSKARRRFDRDYDTALELFVAEEQKHSALFGRALRRFGVGPLHEHWSDAAFVRLRRLMGLRTEVTLFLIAETVALEYFAALERSADPVLRGVARRVLTDEVEHIRFQIAQLQVGLRRVPAGVRMLAAAAAWVVAAGAATVVAVDHGPALRAGGLRPAVFWGRAMRHFRRAAASAFLGRGTGAGAAAVMGPSAVTTGAVVAGAATTGPVAERRASGIESAVA